MAGVLHYFNYKKAKPPQDEADKKEPDAPVLNEETEKFLERVTSSAEERPELPRRHTIITEDGKEIKGKDAQIALMNGANEIPLPLSPGEGEDSAEETEEETGSEKKEGELEKKDKKRKAKDYWSYVPAVPWRSSKNKDKGQAGSDLQAAVDASKTGEADKKPEAAADEDKDRAALTAVLDNLNLSAINNRVFSISKESQEIFDKFSLVLKDIINGAPTAYDDLEHLLTNYEGQLDKMFGSMPPFLQTLVKSLPARMMPAIGPQILAAASEKTGADAAAAPQGKTKRSEDADQTTSNKKKTKKKSKMASLRSLVADQGSVVAMLRSILNYLKLRFPMFLTGTNVLMSLSVFLLLFVFWYCHKRGKETRLANEQAAMENSTSDVEDSKILEKRQDGTAESAAESAEDPDISVPEEAKDESSASAGQDASTGAFTEAKTGTADGAEKQDPAKDTTSALNKPEAGDVSLAKQDQPKKEDSQVAPMESRNET